MIRRAGMVVIACACGSAPAAKYNSASSAPLRVELGACAAPSVAFVSGERAYDRSSNIFGGLIGNEAGEMNGGFGYGRSGFGPGGGGTGWGTIGTGRYGTIGHGSGTGSGYGVGGGRGGMRGRAAAVPRISLGQPSAVGDLDKAIIRRYVKRNSQKLLYCYEKQLLAKPAIAGTVVAQFSIKADGQVDSSAASGVDPEVASCVAAVIKDIEFPKPNGGGGVQVSYPLTFRPADGDSDAPATDEPAPAPAPVPTPEPAHDTAAAAPVDNPFATKRAELAECLRRQARPYGAIVVDLGYDQRGAVTTATTHGLDGAEALACVARVARTIVKPHAPAIERCAIAFGVMPADRLPGLDVASDTIKAERRPIARLADRDAELEAASQRIVAALGVLVADAPQPPPIAMRGPIVLRAIDIAPMKLVNRALIAARAADVAVEPAVLRDGEWRLLHRSHAIPEVPVALAAPEPAEVPQGGAFASLTGTGDISSGFDTSITIDVLVTTKSIVVPANDSVVEVKDAAAFAEQVAKLAHGTWPADAIVVLAARDDVRFGELARAIDVVERAGLHWRIAPPAGN